MTDPKLTAYAKGVMGETAACEHLMQKGMTPVQRRYHTPCGEVDLIMLEGETLVFVEVKARERGTLIDAQCSVTPAKQRRLIDSARYYLASYPEHARRMLRFDVVTVTKTGIHHIPNAFQGAEW